MTAQEILKEIAAAEARHRSVVEVSASHLAAEKERLTKRLEELGFLYTEAAYNSLLDSPSKPAGMEGKLKAARHRRKKGHKTFDKKMTRLLTEAGWVSIAKNVWHNPSPTT